RIAFRGLAEEERKHRISLQPITERFRIHEISAMAISAQWHEADAHSELGIEYEIEHVFRGSDVAQQYSRHQILIRVVDHSESALFARDSTTAVGGDHQASAIPGGRISAGNDNRMGAWLDLSDSHTTKHFRAGLFRRAEKCFLHF